MGPALGLTRPTLGRCRRSGLRLTPAAVRHRWNAGVPLALPWTSSLDVSYVGPAYDVLGGEQATRPSISTPSISATFAPRAGPHTAGRTLPDLLRPYPGYSNILVDGAASPRCSVGDGRAPVALACRPGNLGLGRRSRGTTGLPGRGCASITRMAASFAPADERGGRLAVRRAVTCSWPAPCGRRRRAGPTPRCATRLDAHCFSVGTSSGSIRRQASFHLPDRRRRHITDRPTVGADRDRRRRRCRLLDDQYASSTPAAHGPRASASGSMGRNLLHGCGDHRLDLARSGREGLKQETHRPPTCSTSSMRVHRSPDDAENHSPSSRTLLQRNALPGGAIDRRVRSRSNAGFQGGDEPIRGAWCCRRG